MTGDPSIQLLLARWDPDRRPRYRAILDALTGAVAAGALQPGDHLPAQRALAAALGVDLSTVTRAYRMATERGLIEGTAGRGTFVSARALGDDPGVVDLGMLLPPQPEGLQLGRLIAETTAAVLHRSDVAALMSYHASFGALAQKAAAAAWLEPMLGRVAPERMLVVPGAQAALTAALATLEPGGVVVTDPLTYPGFKALATALRLRLVSCPWRDGGMDPEALEAVVRRCSPAALYLIPTLHNPTGLTMGLEARKAIGAIADRTGTLLIEDDPYGLLLDDPPPAVSSFCEESVFISTLSKTVSPGLRLAYVTAGGARGRLEEALQATSRMPPPLTAAVAASWMRDGTMMRIVEGVRREARARRALAAGMLPEATGGAEGIHVWLPLPPDRSAKALVEAALGKNLALVAADAFIVEGEPGLSGEERPNGVRLALGGPSKREVLAEALAALARLVRGS